MMALAKLHFQYPILRIVGCKYGTGLTPSDIYYLFQYPTLRIVGCKSNVDIAITNSGNVFQYPILRIAGCKALVDTDADDEDKFFQYPILRIVGCKYANTTGSYNTASLSVSYPADRWLPASFKFQVSGFTLRSSC